MNDTEALKVFKSVYSPAILLKKENKYLILYYFYGFSVAEINSKDDVFGNMRVYSLEDIDIKGYEVMAVTKGSYWW